MHTTTFVLQDGTAGATSRVLAAIEQLAGAHEYLQFRTSVAYASLAGCRQLLGSIGELTAGWVELPKTWLVSIDFGQTDPDALELLLDAPNSSVRIPGGELLLRRQLAPTRCFHPKTYLFDSQSHRSPSTPAGVLLGSANLTLGGLHTNVEHAICMRLWGRVRPADAATARGLDRLREWWHRAWQSATVVDSDFIARYRRLRRRSVVYLDRDELAADLSREVPREVGVSDAARWSTAKYFWIETGELYKNRGADRPGNQLDCRRGTRVFFGFPADTVSRNTVFGHVVIQYGRSESQERSVRFGDNFMDKVNLPIPGGVTGPLTYDHSVLRFERTEPGVYHLIVGTSGQVNAWRHRSRRQGMLYSIGQGRPFGFYS